MKIHFSLTGACLLASVASFSAANAAQSSVVQGSIQYQIPVAAPDLSRSDVYKTYTAEEFAGYKTISLMNLNLSDAMKAKMAAGDDAAAEIDYSKKGITSFGKSKGAVDLGMNGVPVLDQGAYGTCVTFSSTAALDALIGKGDYISQQCSLELDKVDAEDDTYPNDPTGGDYWDGAYYATQVVNPLVKQGVIQKGKCFNTTYPSPSASLKDLAQYTAVSNKKLLAKTQEVFHASLTVDEVKAALDKGHRVLIGSVIGSMVSGFSVKVDGKQTSGGLWACKQPSSRTDYCNTQAGGHEIVVVGYDDAQQLLKIRNSWGVNTGDNGDYYMTYSYFTRMDMDGTEVY